MSRFLIHSPHLLFRRHVNISDFILLFARAANKGMTAEQPADNRNIAISLSLRIIDFTSLRLSIETLLTLTEDRKASILLWRWALITSQPTTIANFRFRSSIAMWFKLCLKSNSIKRIPTTHYGDWVPPRSIALDKQNALTQFALNPFFRQLSKSWRNN